MSEEIWKDVVGFEGCYQISNKGNVRSIDHKNSLGRLRKGTSISSHPDRSGYYRVVLWKNGESKRYMVHRLVATAFIENPSNLPMINHIDENKANNNMSNLEWCDCRYNINYGDRTLKTSLALRGENQYNHKLTTEDVRYIKKNYKKRDREYGQLALSRKFNVSAGAIQDIIKGKNWKHVV